MYFKGKLAVDPAQLAKIENVSPESGFRKLLFNLTGGQVADKQEVETFKALNILQQIHGSLEANGITNIIRLTHDDIDIYYDKTGEKNDLKYALDKYEIEIDESMSTHFKTIWMVLEHEDDTYKYLMEISVNKSHKEHEYPIEIVISALLKEFNLKPGESKDELRARMKTYFRDQESYDTFITTKKLAFEQFLESLRFETMKHMRVDDIKMDIHTRMVIQKSRKKEPQQPVEPQHNGMPYGYFGFGDLLLYGWLWSELSYDHHMHISDVDLVSDDGDLISSVGTEGFDATDNSILDYNEDFDTRMDNLDQANVDAGGFEDMDGMDTLIDSDDSKSWFDGVFDDGDFDFDLGDW